MPRPFSTVVLIVVLTALGPAWLWAQPQYELQDGQWAPVQGDQPDAIQGEIQEIRRALAEDHTSTAIELADRWLKRHPDHERRPEVYILRGDAKVADGDYYKALYDYEFVIREYPASTFFMTAQQREFDVAKVFSSGVKRRFLGMRLFSANEETEEVLIRIQERSPGSEIGELASIELGDHYFRRDEMSKAAVAYEMFLLNYPRSLKRVHAMQRLIHANLATFRGPQYDPTGLIEARQRISEFQQEFPAAAATIQSDQLLASVDQSQATKALMTANWYEKRDQAVSAKYLYRQIIKRYPHTDAAKLAIDQLEDMGEPIQKPVPIGRSNQDADLSSGP